MGKGLLTGVVLLLLMAGPAMAQSRWYQEWFQQKKTQNKYLINQIAALQVYIGYLKKGYRIYNKGLTTIGRLKDGTFSLHKDFFLSLKNINPEIARYARVADIVQLQVGTVQAVNRTLGTVRDNGRLRPEEIAYLVRVYGRLLEDCTLLVDELIALTTSGKLEMEDDERLQRIDGLYMEMQDKYRFAERFGREALLLYEARGRQLRDIGIGKHIHKQEN